MAKKPHQPLPPGIPTIDDLLMEFQHKINMYYGVENAITTISFGHEAFDRMMIERYRKTSYSSCYKPSDFGDLKICGIRLKARARKP